MLYSSSYGDVYYEARCLYGCCSVLEISCVKIVLKGDKDIISLYKEFDSYIKNTAMTRTNMFIMTDKDNADNPESSIYDFCTKMRWKRLAVFQSCHGEHNVVMFGYNRSTDNEQV